jgi:hypothetical protein
VSEVIRDAQDFQDALVLALRDRDDDVLWALREEIRSIRTFHEAAMQIREYGLVVRVASGAEFRLVILRTEPPDGAVGYECAWCGARRSSRDEFLTHLIGHRWSWADALHEIGIPVEPTNRRAQENGR